MTNGNRLTCLDCGAGFGVSKTADTATPDPEDVDKELEGLVAPEQHAEHSGEVPVHGHPIYDPVKQNHPWAEMYACPDCGAGATVCRNEFHGEAPAVYPLPKNPDDVWDRDELKWSQDLEGGFIPSGRPGGEESAPTGMEDLPKTKKKVKELENKGLVYHQIVTDPDNPDFESRHVHETRSDAEAAHQKALDAGFGSELRPAQRTKNRDLSDQGNVPAHELSGRPTPGMEGVLPQYDKPRPPKKTSSCNDDWCPLFEVEAHGPDTQVIACPHCEEGRCYISREGGSCGCDGNYGRESGPVPGTEMGGYGDPRIGLDDDEGDPICGYCEGSGKIHFAPASHDSPYGPNEVTATINPEEEKKCAEENCANPALGEFMGKDYCEDHLKYQLGQAPDNERAAEQGIATTQSIDRLKFENVKQELVEDSKKAEQTLRSKAIEDELAKKQQVAAHKYACERCGDEATHEGYRGRNVRGLLCTAHAQTFQSAHKASGSRVYVIPLMKEAWDLSSCAECGHVSENHRDRGCEGDLSGYCGCKRVLNASESADERVKRLPPAGTVPPHLQQKPGLVASQLPEWIRNASDTCQDCPPDVKCTCKNGECKCLPEKKSRVGQNIGCPNCSGTGSNDDGSPCKACFGTGSGGGLMLKSKVGDDTPSKWENNQADFACSHCSSDGCEACDWRGFLPHEYKRGEFIIDDNNSTDRCTRCDWPDPNNEIHKVGQRTAGTCGQCGGSGVCTSCGGNSAGDPDGGSCDCGGTGECSDCGGAGWLENNYAEYFTGTKKQAEVKQADESYQLQGRCLRCGKDVFMGDQQKFDSLGEGKISCSTCAPLIAQNLEMYKSANVDELINYLYENHHEEWYKVAQSYPACPRCDTFGLNMASVDTLKCNNCGGTTQNPALVNRGRGAAKEAATLDDGTVVSDKLVADALKDHIFTMHEGDDAVNNWDLSQLVSSHQEWHDYDDNNEDGYDPTDSELFHKHSANESRCIHEVTPPSSCTLCNPSTRGDTPQKGRSIGLGDVWDELARNPYAEDAGHTGHPYNSEKERAQDLRPHIEGAIDLLGQQGYKNPHKTFAEMALMHTEDESMERWTDADSAHQTVMNVLNDGAAKHWSLDAMEQVANMIHETNNKEGKQGHPLA